MDSVTQAVLGAVVVEAVAGRKLGNRALLWGLWFGTLPDLDILVNPWIAPIERLTWHRGLSHSLLLMTLTAPLWGWLMAWFHRKRGLTWARASWAVWLALFTHVLIDCFTVYGTQILEPFSNVRVGFNNLFIIDPLFTLPMLLALLIIPWLRPDDRRRRWANGLALVLVSLYVAWSFAAKAVVNHRIEAALDADKIPVVRYQTTPTAFNTILWRGLVETKDGFFIGYTSFLDPPGQPIRFDFVPKQELLVSEAKDSRAFHVLAWFSQGYWSAGSTGLGPIVMDWRFGEIRGAGPVSADNPLVPIFAWQLLPTESGWTYESVQLPGPPRKAMLPILWRRILGEPVF
jgi:inner membrane protein